MKNNLFKGVGIGIFDVNNIEVREGCVVRYKDRLYKSREFEGVVVYNPITAQFLIERGENGVDGCASIGGERAYNVEIIDKSLSEEEKEDEFAKLVELNSYKVNSIIKRLKELRNELSKLEFKTMADAVDRVTIQAKIEGIEKVLTTFGINLDTI